ncbi:MAG: oligosaccharide flippase family protein [Isosphaeraceae bacterium]|nr:oligosaccharide flippase family protein [Isosphaeraceae bacterium]
MAGVIGTGQSPGREVSSGPSPQPFPKGEGVRCILPSPLEEGPGVRVVPSAQFAPPSPQPSPLGEEGDDIRDSRRAAHDSLIVTLGGQLERVLGTLTTLALRWGLDPAQLGVYNGLRLYLDQTNRSSLGIGLGAVQEIPVLRAAGREAEAQHIANVAHTTNTLTCLAYAAALVAWAWWRIPLVAGDPLAAEWTWGLVAIAALTLLKRRESFLIAVLRAHQEFALTTRLDILEALISAAAVSLGLWLAGFWGLLAAVGVILGFKIAYLQLQSPLRLRWAWDWPIAVRLMRTGLPILANTAALGAVLNLDRTLILWLVPDGARAAGLYSIAVLGTSWSLDAAGRIVTVLYTYFQTTLGRTSDPAAVARQAARATEAQAPLLAIGAAVAYVFAPAFLGMLMPRYVAGLPALRPLLPGMVLLGLAWPARQALIAIGRPYRLFAATLAGLILIASAGAVGAVQAGIVGVAWGISLGYTVVFLLTSASAFAPSLGWRGWWEHQARLARAMAWHGAGALIAAHLPIAMGPWFTFVARALILATWALPPLVSWSCPREWGVGMRRAGG